MTKNSKLSMTLQLIDRFNGPLGRVMGGLNRLQARTHSAMNSIGKGMATLAAAGAVAVASMLPAGDVYAALGEVKSLDVSQAGLDNLRQKSAEFAAQWGEDSASFIRSSYDIQSAVGGISEAGLASATNAAGVLAKATKANVADMTNYFGSMYGIFQNEADQVGAGVWLENLAGKTAAAVKMFKTTGTGMQRAFESLGSEATSMGVSLNEQMAILGRMQSMMSGSEAGTKYKAFLAGVGKAQDKLGLNFTNQDGTLMSSLDILSTIEGKFGDISKVADSDLLKKAFGSQEATAFIKALIKQREKLKVDVDLLGGRDGLDTAIQMAQAMTTPWGRIIQGSKALMASFGFDSLQSAVPGLNSIADGIQRIISMRERLEHIPDIISNITKYSVGFVAILGAMWVVIGLVKLGAIALSPVLTILKFGFFKLIPAVAGFTAALLANPIVWIVLAIAGLIAALVGLVVYWDEVKAAIGVAWDFMINTFRNNKWMQMIFAPLYIGMEVIDALINHFDKIPQWWKAFIAWFRDIDIFGGLFAGVVSSINGMIDNVNLIPGINIDRIDDSAGINETRKIVDDSVPIFNSGVKADVPKGGIMQSYFDSSNQQNNNNQRSVHIEKIEMSTDGNVGSGQSFLYELEMEAG